MKFREKKLSLGKKMILGKDEESNDELMKNFKGKPNTILHTMAPGSPFGVIIGGRPDKEELSLGGAFVAGRSQDWRDNKKDVIVNVFTGKDISKPRGYKPGTWKVKKSVSIKIKKEDIKKLERVNRE